MKYRKKILMCGCLLMICLLTACHKGDGGKVGMISIAETSDEVSEGMMENVTAEEVEAETAIDTMEVETGTVTETTMEPESQMETDMAENTDDVGQEEITWLDQAVAEVLGKNPGELKETDYMAIKSLAVYGGNIQEVYCPQNNIVKLVIRGKSGTSVVPFENLQYDVIDMQDIVKCSNLKNLEINLDYTTHPETYIIHYDELIKLKKLESLEISLNGNTSSFSDIADQIDDLSFVCEMPNLTSLILKNIDLPDDLSPLFSHPFQKIVLANCNITEDDFSDLGDDIFYPRRLDLPWNQIKDATILTAMQTRLLCDTQNAVYCLCLGENPLEKLGECLTEERLKQYENVPEGIYLYLSGTNYEDYSFDWYMH